MSSYGANSGSGAGKGASGGFGSGGSAFTPYTVTSRGTNSQGNRYDTRTQPCGRAYHYSNANGSYYYSNGDGSTYYNSGNGYSSYQSGSRK